METNWNQLIERYLNNELSAEDKAAFETELQGNPELRKEFELHQLTKELILRNSLRTLVNQSGKWFHLKKILINSGIALVIAGALTAAVYFVASGGNKSNKKETPELMEKSMIENLEKYLAFENVNPEYFKFTGESDVFLSASGVLLSITDNSFLLDGKPYTGEAIVQWQEAQKASDIVKAGLSTISGDKLLETQGMFSLNAFTPEGKKLELTKEGVYVQVPVDELKKDMKLFTGVPGKNGTIDWQNPEELERLPKPKNMARMDLFPPKYEPKLNELKWFTEKTKRDSLYLSFEENLSEAQFLWGSDTVSSEQQIKRSVKENRKSSTLQGIEKPEDMVRWSFSVEYLNNNEVNIVATVNLEENWMVGILNKSISPFTIPTRFRLDKSPDFAFVGEAKDLSPIAWAIDSETAEKYQIKKYCKEMAIYESSLLVFKQKIKLLRRGEFEISGNFSCQVCKAQSQCLPPYLGEFTVQVSSNVESNKHIPPSKVLAIWNKKFNNTNLATQDFEDRMKAIHETCNEKVFDVYAKNLNEPLWKLDQRVVKMGYPEFQVFADQKVGAVRINDGHQKNLDAFYEKAIESIREKGRQNFQTARGRERLWDTEVQKERDNEVLRKGLRESANLNEEYGFNLANVGKQLGKTLGFQIHNGGPIVNIDKYVWDATVARQSTVITDPETGKTARITYEPLSLEVKESGKYNKLYLYLFSKEINSYQRLDFKNGKLDYNLNGDMNYRAFVVGMNEKGYFYHQINELKAEDLGMISLEEISEKEFDKRINTLNEHRTDKPMSLKDELKWLFKEKANYTVQKKRRENAAFRREIRPTIYSCGQSEIPDNTSILVQ
ncbi:MAG: cytochrome c class [Fluviicola sp.]|jgi:hypothetical protein|uniref:anti-sigma factor family protein n=1 Tax=Fluviicola sp. TaxID=1917219 RepID=UPI002607C0EA|nr:hypothetical protein [Fluviicola sp.]MDF3028049.1 cytochrome c class [Fluviicola sp.]